MGQSNHDAECDAYVMDLSWMIGGKGQGASLLVLFGPGVSLGFSTPSCRVTTEYVQLM